MARLCIIIFILMNVMFFSQQADDSSVFTSPVLKRSRSNYLSFAGKTYYFGTIFKTNFFRAIQFCRQQGMQLVSIASQAENERLGKFVTEIGAYDGHFWTSGTNLGDENQFVWLSSGNNLIYSNWDPREPSLKSPTGTTENCIEVRFIDRGFSWNDINCNFQAYFICESISDCS